MNKTLIFHENSHIDLNASFAPGTYIELQLEKESDKTLNWSYIECNSEKKMRYLLDTDCRSIETKDLKFIASFKGNICGFHLPISRSNEPKEDIQDYKYYIIVFAYDEEKTIPSLEDFHIVIDMSFRVGVGRDEDAKESKLRNDFNNDIMQTNSIFSVFEAVEFLKACQSLKEKTKETNNYEFFKNYPQLAGKIAYIYYRFDLANEKFIQSVSDKDKYLEEREKFITTLEHSFNKEDFINLFKTDKFMKQLDVNKEKEYIKIFMENIRKEFKIPPFNFLNNFTSKILSMPKISFDTHLYIDFYDFEENTIHIEPINAVLETNWKEELQNLLNSIVHEFRHFYIHYIINSKLIHNSLIYFIYYQIYISGSQKYENIFKAYNKKTEIFDDSSIKRYKTYGDLSGINVLYFIQPKERDAGMVAYYWLETLKEIK